MPNGQEERLLDEVTEEWEALIQFVARYRNGVTGVTDHTEKQASILDRLIEKLGEMKIALMRQIIE